MCESTIQTNERMEEFSIKKECSKLFKERKEKKKEFSIKKDVSQLSKDSKRMEERDFNQKEKRNVSSTKIVEEKKLFRIRLGRKIRL